MRLRNLSTAAQALMIVIFLLTGSAFAERHDLGSIAGVVQDSQTGKAVSGASVFIDGLQNPTITDQRGEFRIENLKPGKLTIEVTHADYQTAAVEVTVRQGEVSQVTVILDPVKVEEESREGTSSSQDDSDSNYKTKKTKGDKKTTAERRYSSSVRDQSEIQLDCLVPPAAPDATAKIGIPAPGIVRMPKPVPQDEFDGGSYYSTEPYDMYFKDYGTNRFINTRQDRFSTFAADVDDASYNMAREYLMGGNLPPREAIRIEEFLNHFDYGYNPPTDKEFRVFHELMPSPFDNTQMLKIGIKGQEFTRRERQPLNLTFVIDVSGSMSYGNRIDLVRQSLQMLVDQLGPSDRIGIVAYGDHARVILDPVSADQRRNIYRAIKTLRPGGSTYAEAGLKLGYEMANRQYIPGHTNRVILCSDGVANVGKTSPDAIMAEIKRFANRGLTLSTFGYGMGNYNDVLLEQLATKGNGRYAYVNDLNQARELFVDEFVSAMQLLARDVKIQVEFDPDVVSSYRLIGYENRDVADNRFRDNRQDGGEVGPGHEVTALYELNLTRKGRSGKVGTVSVRWTTAEGGEVAELSKDLGSGKKTKRRQNARPELRVAVAAAQFGELLKNTVYVSESSFSELYRFTQRVADDMNDEQSRQLLELIRRAEALSGYHTDYHPDYHTDRWYKD